MTVGIQILKVITKDERQETFHLARVICKLVFINKQILPCEKLLFFFQTLFKKFNVCSHFVFWRLATSLLSSHSEKMFAVLQKGSVHVVLDFLIFFLLTFTLSYHHMLLHVHRISESFEIHSMKRWHTETSDIPIWKQKK